MIIIIIWNINNICFVIDFTFYKYFVYQCMHMYEDNAIVELRSWQDKMQRHPSLVNKLAKGLQHKINRIIPKRVHKAFTVAIKQMVRSMLFGAEYTTKSPLADASLQERERLVQKRINFYEKVAATEGGITGTGGFLMAMADFPALLGIKMKLLYEIAALYGHDVKDYRERLYLLRIFQLAFSSQQQRNIVYQQIKNWDQQRQGLPTDIHSFDWLTFQLEYRDYIDLAKLAQMIPGIGAVVGLAVNYRLIKHLGKTAMNAYRMRWEASSLPMQIKNKS